MKKSMSILIVLQVAFLALGYGAGTYLNKPDDTERIDATDSGDSHGSTPAQEEHASKAENADIIVKLGQMIIPVYKPRSVTYVVINLGVAVDDLKMAEHYNIGENGVRLRDDIFATLKLSADGQKMRGAVIDTEYLTKSVTASVQQNFTGINDVLFLDFYKKDIARS